MTDPVEKKRKFIINVAYWALIFAIVYFVMKKAVIVCMPFVISFILAACLQPLIRIISRKFKIKQKPASLIVVTLFFCTVGLLVTLLVIRLVITGTDLASELPHFYSEMILPTVESAMANLQNLLRKFKPDITVNVNEVISWLGDRLQQMTFLAEKAVDILSGIPGLVVSTFIAIVSTYFMSSDFEGISAWCLAQLSEKHRNTVLEIKKYITEILFKYIRSYLLIILVTFSELLAGLFVISRIFTDMFSGFGHILAVSAIVAVFDILPVVGTGTVVVPWAIIQFLTGAYGKGVALLILYGITLTVRQVIEPKIIGVQVGLHPVATLMAMIIGTSLFGVVGLFGFPVTLALLADLNRRGKIHIFKRVHTKPEPEEPTKQETE